MTVPADEPGRPAVDARYGQGIQIGDHNTQHVHLTASTPASSAVVTTIHAEPGIEVFVGRAPQIERLAAALAPADGEACGPVVVCAVQGMGGIGKTALARRAAAEAVSRGWFPGGAVFVDLRGYDLVLANRMRPGQVFAPVLRALGVPPEEIPADAAQQPTAYHQHLDALAAQGRRVLVVLDNAADLAQVQDLLPTPMAARTHRVVITTRDTLRLPGVDRVEVGVLAPPEAAELLRATLDQRARVRGLPADPRPGAETAAVAEVLRWCGWLPLAVVIAAGVLAEEPDLAIGELAADLADARTRLDVLDDGAGGVHAAFLTSWQRLRARDPQAARLLCLLTTGPGPDIGLPAAAAVLGASEAAARVRLRVLTRAHLLSGGPRRWAFHDLLRLDVTRHAVQDLAVTEADLAAATDRVLGYYLATTRAALNWMATVRAPVPAPTDGPFAGWEEGLAWLDGEQAPLVAAVAVAADTGRDRLAVDLASGLARFLSWRRQVADWVAVAQIADRAVRRLADVPGTIRAMENLGAALVEARRFEDAVSNLTTARLAGRVLLDDMATEARVCDSLGLALQGMGDSLSAAHEHGNAVGIFQELGDRRGEGAAWSNLGIAWQHLGRFSDAVGAHCEASEIFRELGDRRSEGMAQGNLAVALHAMGWWNETINVLSAVRDVFREIGDRHSECQAWTDLGALFRRLRRFDEAVTAFTAVADICAEIGDRRGEAQAWRDLEQTFAAAGRPDDARRAAERAAPAVEADGAEEPVRFLRGWRIRSESE
ncbi:hypothetical protein ALI22I_23885 [Saccharothrix sp. ALI-22-I]|uniref:tetratricopeptide repeat protein n=1 Tax=Saccharothrix sp. ALI-22-I TaxID=1933778 RepID=UPI00097BAEF1|nr:tetratricopeptide repeat protein [Saccharothrix sp. ALI-22-I]ONI86674.1 hypothetical protein ALI22I_23885 [Saccharothrix sp. ALI-22-I]